MELEWKEDEKKKTNGPTTPKPEDKKYVYLTPYRPLHTDPKACNAEFTCFWELGILKTHYHPTVSNWAAAIMKNESIVYSGDPLRDFDMPTFLDRFSFKKPKKLQSKETDEDGNIKNPQVIFKKTTVSFSLTEKPVSDPSFLELPTREEEVFFHKFFSNKAIELKKSKKEIYKKYEDDNEIDDIERVNRQFDKVVDKFERNADDKDFWNISEGYDYEDLRDLPFSDDEDYLSVSNEDEDEDDDDFGDDAEGDLITPNQKRKRDDDFADLEEFSHILETSGMEDNTRNKRKKKSPSSKKSPKSKNPPKKRAKSK